MPRNLSNIFTITSFFDSARWSSQDNYNLINFVSDNLTNDDKLLTHWLCYIADRQMGFERIWDVAGFIFSDAVNSIRLEKNLSLLDPSAPNKSFFVKSSEFAQSIDSSDDVAKESEGYLFVGRHKVGENSILLDYGFSHDTYPHFLSRYYPSDYKAMLFTLIILKDFNFSIVEYLLPILNRNISKKPLIPRLLFSLYLLTYYDIGQPSKKDINFKVWFDEGTKRRDYVLGIINEELSFEKMFSSFSKNAIYKQKRAWCSLRDFFKSPQFNSYFFSSLKEHGFKHLDLLCDCELLKQFELPGDVWNNNSKFRNCILEGTSYKGHSSESFNKLLRKIFIAENISTGYPEQFDITFDFVPRMCNKWNCDFCPYGKDVGQGLNLDKICNMNTAKYCPVILACCGYKRFCDPEKCELVRLK